MKTIIKGQKYNFCVVADRAKFYIEAIHLASLKFSSINNLNVILSEFNIDIDDERVSEPQWFIPARQNKLFFRKAVNFLSDKIYRDYLERKLDEDRKCGEWENSKII